MGVACVLIEEGIRRKCNCLSENPEWERAREEREKSIQEKKQKEMQLLKTLNLKVRALIEKRESQKPRIIGYGNYCKNPCYEFNLSLFEKCPKCEGKITKEYENPILSIETRYDNFGYPYQVTNYDYSAFCDAFKFDKSICKEDVSMEALSAYFQHEEKDGDKINYYMILDGEKINFGENKIADYLKKEKNSEPIFTKMNEDGTIPNKYDTISR